MYRKEYSWQQLVVVVVYCGAMSASSQKRRRQSSGGRPPSSSRARTERKSKVDKKALMEILRAVVASKMETWNGSRLVHGSVLVPLLLLFFFTFFVILIQSIIWAPSAVGNTRAITKYIFMQVRLHCTHKRIPFFEYVCDVIQVPLYRGYSYESGCIHRNRRLDWQRLHKKGRFIFSLSLISFSSTPKFKQIILVI